MTDDTQDFLEQQTLSPTEYLCARCRAHHSKLCPAAWLKIMYMGKLKDYRSVIFLCAECRQLKWQGTPTFIPLAQADPNDIAQAWRSLQWATAP